MLFQVSVFWVNYNSMHIAETIKESLDAIFELDYPSYEVIVVDNGSTDGSAATIQKYLEKVRSGIGTNERVKFIGLKRNWGFAGGNNAAYRARDRRSKYVALINNDLVPRSDYLRKLATFMDEHRDIGAVQGIVVRIADSSIIDSAGFFLDESLRVYDTFLGPASQLREPILVSGVEGTMPMYRVDSLLDTLPDSETLYVPSAFMYYLEDVLVSLLLWNHGYKCAVLPIVAGKHLRLATIRRYVKSDRALYYGLRNRIALLSMTNSGNRKIYVLKNIRKLVVSKHSMTQRKIMLRALIDGIMLGQTLEKKYGTIDLYRAPLIRTPIRERFLI